MFDDILFLDNIFVCMDLAIYKMNKILGSEELIFQLRGGAKGTSKYIICHMVKTVVRKSNQDRGACGWNTVSKWGIEGGELKGRRKAGGQSK